MMKNTARLLFLLASILPASVLIAKQPPSIEARPGHWIVELQAPSTLNFEGGDVVMTTQADNAGTKVPVALSATAPSITGRRLNVLDADVQAYVSVLDQERTDVLVQMGNALGRSIAPYAEYRHIMNGFAVQMAEAEAELARSLPEVKSITPDWVHRRHTDRGPNLIGASTLWGLYPDVSFGPNKGEGIVIGIIDSGINFDHEAFKDEPPFTNHDYVNPYPSLLGECSKPQVTCNDKLVGVYDFTTEGTFGKDPDNDGHGTHVASTAAGNAASFTLQRTGDYVFNTSGVAPHAHIVSYKVCYNDHPTDDELDETCVGSAISQALEQAVVDQVDVVNYSIGGGASNPWSAASRFLPLWQNDIAFVTSAGNSGPGPETISNPANAPWVMTVGNSTHDRLVAGKASVGQITDIAVVPSGAGPAVSANITASARRVDQIVSGNLLACDPLPAGSLSGQIAVIQRGTCTFATKINHATAAGAIAVLVSNQVDGLPIAMGGVDGTTIPAVMMGKSDGDEVLSLLAGGPVQATLFTGTEVSINFEWADNMASSSSRGPAPFVPGLMKPNVVAPGTDILAAYVPNENSLAFLSGTSMASPHVAGAAALLRSIHLNWDVDAVFSALQTTAQPNSVKDNGVLASIHDRGAGRINVALASRVGLYLPLKGSEFAAANPDGGGDPSTLNLPGLINESCGLSCSFTRTVKAHRDGDWTVSVIGDLNVTVSPTSFSLDEGQTQVLTITATPTPALAGDLEEARIELREAPPPSFATNVTRPVRQYLTLAIANNKSELPSLVSFTTGDDKGQKTVAIASLRGLSRARFVTSDLSPLEETTIELTQDPTRDDAYSGTGGRQTFLMDVTEGSFGVFAQTTESGAKDIDLFVGFDANGDGIAQENEEACASTSPDATELCWIDAPVTGQWWVLVQNWESSAAGATDPVTVQYGVAERTEDPVLFVAGPGTHAGGELDLALYFDDPSLKADDLRIGALEIFSGLSTEEEFVASIPLVFERSLVTRPKTTVLFPNESLYVNIQGGQVHEKLFIDVPPTATELAVTVQGDAGITASLRRVAFDQLPEFAPDTPPVPSTSLASGSGSSSGFTMTLNNPEAGRYYVVLDNSLGADRSVEVTTVLTESGQTEPRYALYSPVGREINQGLEFQNAGQPFAVWYSFDGGGVPIFYLGSAPWSEDSSVWVSPLDRYTQGLESQLATPAGRMAFTVIDRETAIFSWRLNGAHGSDLMSAGIIPETCVTEGGMTKSYTGHWYSPGRDQGGSTTIMSPGIQIQVRYYYDAVGIGRWVQLYAPSGGETAENLLVREYRGNCPNCDHSTAPTFDDIGTYSRQYSSESAGEEVLVFESGPPLLQSFATPEGLPIQKLSARLACPE